MTSSTTGGRTLSRRLFALAAAGALTVGLAACGGGSSTGSASTGGASSDAATPAAKTLKLGISVPALDTPFFSVLVDNATKAAQDAGGSVVQTANANRDAGQQVTDFRNLIAAGANAIMAGVVDNKAIQPALDYAKSKGVPVVIVDDAPAAGTVTAIVRANNVDMGKTAADAMAKLLPNGGTVLAISGDLATTNGQDRAKGFADQIAKVAPNIKVIDQTANWNGPQAGNVMTTVLAKTPDLAGVYMATDTLYWDPVSAALKARNKLVPAGQSGHVATVAIDGGAGALKSIRDGFLDGTVSQPVDVYAKTGVQYLADALAGKTIAEGATDHNSTVVKAGENLADLLPSPLVTKDNVDDANLWGNAK